MKNLTGESMNITEENLKAMQQLFPEAFEEGKIDFDVLRQLLGDFVDDEQERYSFKWNGKGKALRLSQTPSMGTLRPCKEESKDWDNTENLYIEGDNLEVLKLLQKSYYGKVKMIYIEPPYNTGGDFVYKDNFHDNIQNYKEITGQVDSDGNHIDTNTEANGRFHTDWLNMMYPRLRLARNLLSDDGVIFISIDDNEQENLKRICDEVFGPNNFIAQLIWQNKKGGGNDSVYFAVEHEYVYAYSKDKNSLSAFYEMYTDEYAKRYKEDDEFGKFFWDTFKRKAGKQYYPIECPDGTILQYDSDGNPISWLRSKQRYLEDLKKGEIRFCKDSNGKWSVQFKQRMPKGKKPRSIFNTIEVISGQGTTSSGSQELHKLFGKDVFFNPKPVELINFLLGFASNEECIIMDFFSGSGTTAHAVMEANSKDNGKRRYILVQLPVDITSSANGTGSDASRIIENEKNVLDGIGKPYYLTEIAKERIIRAAKDIRESLADDSKQDFGFKVFKLDTSNMKKWNSRPDNIQLNLQEYAENFLPERTELDVVYEILIKLGIDISISVEEHEVAEQKIYIIGYGALMICLSDRITISLAEAIVDLHREFESELWRVVFRDNGFVSDKDKTNIKEFMKTSGLLEENFVSI